jgi:hypothetical protein
VGDGVRQNRRKWRAGAAQAGNIIPEPGKETRRNFPIRHCREGRDDEAPGRRPLVMLSFRFFPPLGVGHQPQPTILHSEITGTEPLIIRYNQVTTAGTCVRPVRSVSPGLTVHPLLDRRRTSIPPTNSFIAESLTPKAKEIDDPWRHHEPAEDRTRRGVGRPIGGVAACLSSVSHRNEWRSPKSSRCRVAIARDAGLSLATAPVSPPRARGRAIRH